MEHSCDAAPPSAHWVGLPGSRQPRESPAQKPIQPERQGRADAVPAPLQFAPSSCNPSLRDGATSSLREPRDSLETINSVGLSPPRPPPPASPTCSGSRCRGSRAQMPHPPRWHRGRPEGGRGERRDTKACLRGFSLPGGWFPRPLLPPPPHPTLKCLPRYPRTNKFSLWQKPLLYEIT